ncbi:MAG: ASCH domain-containing protein [Bacilli bacterium]|nr:ASCH domain-containing protein [Bacilli bacterium]
MKVLSLTEPCATLKKEKTKTIEIRSWKTSYRGEMYIHASSTKIPKAWKEDEKFMSLVEGIPLNYGKTICKC